MCQCMRFRSRRCLSIRLARASLRRSAVNVPGRPGSGASRGRRPRERAPSAGAARSCSCLRREGPAPGGRGGIGISPRGRPDGEIAFHADRRRDQSQGAVFSLARSRGTRRRRGGGFARIRDRYGCRAETGRLPDRARGKSTRAPAAFRRVRREFFDVPPPADRRRVRKEAESLLDQVARLYLEKELSACVTHQEVESGPSDGHLAPHDIRVIESRGSRACEAALPRSCCSCECRAGASSRPERPRPRCNAVRRGGAFARPLRGADQE